MPHFILCNILYYKNKKHYKIYNYLACFEEVSILRRRTAFHLFHSYPLDILFSLFFVRILSMCLANAISDRRCAVTFDLSDLTLVSSL